VATGWTTEGSEFETWYGLSRQVLGPTRPPIQWVQGVISPGVKRPRREADHSSPASTKVKKIWIYTSTPPLFLHGVVLKYLSTGTILPFLFLDLLKVGKKFNLDTCRSNITPTTFCCEGTTTALHNIKQKRPITSKYWERSNWMWRKLHRDMHRIYTRTERSSLQVNHSDDTLHISNWRYKYSIFDILLLQRNKMLFCFTIFSRFSVCAYRRGFGLLNLLTTYRSYYKQLQYCRYFHNLQPTVTHTSILSLLVSTIRFLATDFNTGAITVSLNYSSSANWTRSVIFSAFHAELNSRLTAHLELPNSTYYSQLNSSL
jgi:hypothetical protein